MTMIRKCVIASVLVAMTALTLANPAAARHKASQIRAFASHQPVYPFGNYDFQCEDVIGESTLVRVSDHRYSGQMCLKDPTYAGHAMTVWVVWFQRPRNCDSANPTCQSSDLNEHGGFAYGGGGLVDEDGNFCTAFSLEHPQDLEPADDMNLAGWYRNPYDASVRRYRNYAMHVVARTHGPAVDGTAEEYVFQISGLNTTCKPDGTPCANIAHSLHERRFDTSCR